MGLDDLFTVLFLIGGIGTWYFIKKRPDKKLRNISIGLIVLSVVGMGFIVDDEEEPSETASANTTETSTSIADTSKEVQKSKEQEAKESKEAEESKEKEIEESKEKETEKSKKREQQEKEEAEKKEKAEQEKKKKEEANKPENKFKSTLKKENVKGAKVNIDENNNAIITIPTESVLTENNWINMQFPDDVLPLLKTAKSSGVENIIVKTNAEFTDQKGNNEESLAMSVMYTKENLNEINFKNWEDQVLADGLLLYEVSDAYYIHPGIYQEAKSDTQSELNGANKTFDNDFWYDNGLS